ncbi:MAG: tail fiber domain-containing protein, partial [Xanthomonadales bacterium]|nr:tail fiber domain-containing protein [Xanthomonadales bacterium]
SSRRWKSNVRNIDDPLTKIGLLRGVYFDWDAEHGGKHDIGFIAEEVGEVLPEIVQYEENGVDAIGLDYSMVSPLLVEAINALRAESQAAIANLQAENQSLRADLKQLQQQLADPSKAGAAQ